MTAQPNVPLSPPEEERPTTLLVSGRMAGLYHAAVMDVGRLAKRKGTRAQAEASSEALLSAIAQLEADLAAARSALKDSFDRAYDLACLLNVERPSVGGASPHRFNDYEKL